jgi:hypothetical protein
VKGLDRLEADVLSRERLPALRHSHGGAA